MNKDINFDGKTAAVLGVGVSNRPLIEYLLDKGAIITARDMKSRDRLEPFVSEFEKSGVRVICGDGYLDGLKEEYIFRTPGIRFDKPQLIEAVKNGSILTSEMELFFDICPAKIIAVTGSNGKTTTTTIISKMIERQFGRVFLGGNIGKPLLPDIERMTEKDYAVVELSSFQLQTMRHSPDIAVVVNIEPNHLDYHLNMDEYVDAKRNIYLYQKDGDRLVLNHDNEYTYKMAETAAKGVEVIFFNDANGVFESEGGIYFKGELIMNVSDIKVDGHHNVENYMTAIGAIHGIVNNTNIIQVARNFNGVEHRIEFVRELNGIRYYNSSIDSSPSRTIAAMETFRQKLIVILGGYDKHIPFEPLAIPLSKHAKAIILTGAAAPKIKDVLMKCGAKLPPIFEDNTFEGAVHKAHDTADRGDIVLLSPACASFDAFPNFEARGKLFKEIVYSFKR